VEIGGLSSKLAEALLVFKIEMDFEKGERVLDCRFVAPFFGCMGEDSCVFEHCKGEADGGHVGDGFDGGGKGLAFADSNPDVLNGVVRVPVGRQSLPILFEVIWGDLDVGVLEVDEHDTGRDIGESEILVFEDLEVASVDGFEELLF
jgi:hypothetical protein